MSTSPISLTSKPKRNKWLITISITFGTLMGAIDASIVNVALNHIQGAVGASVQEVTWVTTGYALANVLVMPLTAFLARLFGQKRVYMICLGIFLFGSVLCGLAKSLWTLVFCRAIQGFGAGALQPTEQAILRQTFPPKEQATAMAIFGMAVMLGPALGPTLGGYIVDNYAWQWIFYINVPVGLLGLFMVWSFVDEDEAIREANRELAEKQRKNIDYWGITLLSVGLCSLQYFLEEGQRYDWLNDHFMAGCLVVSLLTLVAFVVRELTCAVPVVNLRLFQSAVFTTGTLFTGMMFAMLMGSMFLLPLFMQQLLGFTAMQSGLALMPRVLMMMAFSPVVGKLYNFIQPRLIVGFGLIVYFIGSYMMSNCNLQMTAMDVIWPNMIQGLAFACLFVPLTTTALADVPREKLSDATGLSSLIRQIGGSIGLAIFATMLERHGQAARTSLVAHLSPVIPEVNQRLTSFTQMFVAKGLPTNLAEKMGLTLLNVQVSQQASLLSFNYLFIISGVCFLLMMPLLIFLKTKTAVKAAEISLEH